MSIATKNVSKRYGSFVALHDVTLDFPSGELTALLGPSGSGKTTLLRIIAGLETPDTGTIDFHGEEATDRSVRDRRVGFVFQHYALFRHLSVFENVAFGLRVRPRKVRPPESEIRQRVRRLLELVQLDWLSDRQPSQLSGGQRQRVALARALAVEPRVLLLDEPFGALDAKVRKELRRWLRRLHDEVHVTTVFVTHDQDEAMEVADRVVVMNEGKVEQVGSAETVYEHPATPFVVSFFGDVNLFRGRLSGGRVEIGDVTLAAPDHAETVSQDALAFVRAHEVDLVTNGNGGSAIDAVIRHVRVLGSEARVELDRLPGGEHLEAAVPLERLRERGLRVGDRVAVVPRRLRIFPAAG